MPKRLELTGQRFGKLTVIRRSHQDQWQAWVWACQCDCGTEVPVRGATLKAGSTAACASCAAVERNTTHGQSRTPLYARWRAMIERTRNSNSDEFRNYGGRGISVCERWSSFENFASDMGPTFRPELTLDRLDVDGNYEPDNCRWATQRDQQRNKRTNHVVTWRGRSLVVTDWAELLGLNPNTVVHRLRRGWTVERALTKDADPAVLLDLANRPAPAA